MRKQILEQPGSVIAENKGHIMKKIQPDFHPANEKNFLYKDLL